MGKDGIRRLVHMCFDTNVSSLHSPKLGTIHPRLPHKCPTDRQSEMGRFLQKQKRPKRHSGSDGGRAHTRARSVAARFEVTLPSVAAFASSRSPVRVDVSLRARHRSPPKPRDFRDARFQMREATVARGGSSLGAIAPPPPTSRSLPRRFKPAIDPGAGLDFDRMPGALALADPEVRALREDARASRERSRVVVASASSPPNAPSPPSATPCARCPTPSRLSSPPRARSFPRTARDRPCRVLDAREASTRGSSPRSVPSPTRSGARTPSNDLATSDDDDTRAS